MSRRWRAIPAGVASTALLVAAAACGSGTGPATLHRTSGGATARTSGQPQPPAGLGATQALWRAHHSDAYSSVLADAHGRVDGYVLAMTARPLAQAEVLVEQDLPPDAVAGAPRQTEGVEGTKCVIVDFTSPVLQQALGGAHGAVVTAVFQATNAIVMDTNLIARVVVVSGNENFPSGC